MQTAAVKKLIAHGKERGYLTYDELNAALPQDQVSSEQIEDTMTMLSELGINWSIEGRRRPARRPKPAAAEGRSGEEEEGGERAAGNLDDADIGRTDDPVRMYLREMGSVELLSREGEIAIAKRIEAGRDMMIGGICEKPADLPRDHLLARPAQGRARCCCATSSISTRPMAAAPDRPADGDRAGVEAPEAAKGEPCGRMPRPRTRRSRPRDEEGGEEADLARRHGSRAQAGRCSRPSRRSPHLTRSSTSCEDRAWRP